MTASYPLIFWGIIVIIATVILQSLIAAAIKGKQPDAIPGKIDPSLSHSSLIFRTHRTFMNSLENTTFMLATIFLGLFMGVSVFWMGIWIWIYALARIFHMILYYGIATEKNPSPRSYFYLIGLIANIALLVHCALVLI
ncbi:MAPEG family protein [Pseudidiomarina sp.]|uniref:MAPEG family protein n=1 Tax=Pseudidiomarina sp. TaxID=2081707 RepID=UPI00299DBF09|nr:MAPEG family protein [Pseudidiomarina sp.]MDX1706161.1 MAPEG family protein [Pseudidiomarina sp.]